MVVEIHRPERAAQPCVDPSGQFRRQDEVETKGSEARIRCHRLLRQHQRISYEPAEDAEPFRVAGRCGRAGGLRWGRRGKLAVDPEPLAGKGVWGQPQPPAARQGRSLTTAQEDGDALIHRAGLAPRRQRRQTGL